MKKGYLIVGAGVAGVSACEAIRKLDPSSEVHLITDESHPFYSRIRLPEIIAGKVTPEKIILKGKEWFSSRQIHLHLNERVTKAEGNPIRLHTTQGEYTSQKLLLATGGCSFVPPIPGARDLKGVFTLRNMDDALRIADWADKSKKALVIGGGLLGLEAANGLRLRGLRVEIAEIFDRLLPRQMDPEGARILQNTMESMGFAFHLEAKSREIQGERGRAKGLLLEDGRFVEAELILISAGVRPNLELAKQLNLKIQKATVVDDRLETSMTGVFAAGDAAEHNGIYYGIWPAAEEQGKVAGANMAGGDERYRGTVPSNRLKVVGIDLISSGEIDPDGEMDCEVYSEPQRGIYRKIVYEQDRIIGCILLGDVSGHGDILQAIARKVPLGDLKGRLLKNPKALSDKLSVTSTA
jgi:nitrite reductase (NADH) large subunit